MLSGPGALDALKSLRSLATPWVVTVIGSIWDSDFLVVSGMGDPSSVVNTDLNWFNRRRVLDFVSLTSFLWSFRGNTPTLSCRFDVMYLQNGFVLLFARLPLFWSSHTSILLSWCCTYILSGNGNTWTNFCFLWLSCIIFFSHLRILWTELLIHAFDWCFLQTLDGICLSTASTKDALKWSYSEWMSLPEYSILISDAVLSRSAQRFSQLARENCQYIHGFWRIYWGLESMSVTTMSCSQIPGTETDNFTSEGFVVNSNRH